VSCPNAWAASSRLESTLEEWKSEVKYNRKEVVLEHSLLEGL
jgi:hypothetical protein